MIKQWHENFGGRFSVFINIGTEKNDRLYTICQINKDLLSKISPQLIKNLYIL